MNTSIDTPGTFREALRALSSSQKTSKGAPAYSRYVNRKLGRVLAAFAYRLGRTPNQVTLVSGVFTMTGIATIALIDPTPASAVLTGVLLVLGYALDAADGQLARLRGGGSPSGEWLDHVVDAFKIGVLHLAVVINWYRFGDLDERWLLVPLAFQAVATIQFFTIILMDQMRRAHRGTTQMLLQGDASSSLVYSLAVVPTDYGLLCVAFLLLGWNDVFVWAYTAICAGNAAFVALALPKWFGEVGRFAPTSRAATPTPPGATLVVDERANP